jgi:NAD(P)-dependent dehydrogenase (short-subunit alcohol dehydrogenase family)
MMTRSLEGMTALVTGSTSNIGRAIARRFAEQGATVAVSGRDVARGTSVVDGIRATGGSAVFIRADLDAGAGSAFSLAGSAVAELGGRVDILVNNAATVPIAGTVATDEAMLDAAWGLNVKAPFFLVARLAPMMAARGSGAIINISSWMARTGTSGVVAYSATKAALDALTRAPGFRLAR